MPIWSDREFPISLSQLGPLAQLLQGVMPPEQPGYAPSDYIEPPAAGMASQRPVSTLPAATLAEMIGANRVIPQGRGTAEEALAALYGMTGIPDIKAGAQALQRGEYLPGLGQAAFGLGSLAALGAPVARGAMTVGREALGAVPGVLADTRGAIRAFHGSPHDFERFDTSKIGTGEGAQAYGHGLYFSETPDVARTYQSKVAAMQGAGPTVDGRAIDWNNPLETAAFELMRHNGDRAAAADFFERTFAKGSPVPGILRSDAVLPEVKPAGRMYEVSINAEPEQFLDWDKPLSQQSEGVRAALAPHYGEVTTRSIGKNPHLGEELHDLLVNGHSIGAFPESAIRGQDLKSLAMQFDPRTGSGIYEKMAKDIAAMSTEETKARFGERGLYGDLSALSAESFREAGIPGIRYLDQGSRGAGGGTSNYVLFSDDIIDIIKKYGLAGLIAPGALAPTTQDR